MHNRLAAALLTTGSMHDLRQVLIADVGILLQLRQNSIIKFI